MTPRILEPDQEETSTRNVQRFTWFGHFYNNSHTWASADGLNCYSGGAFGFIKSHRNAHFEYEPAYIGMGIHEETDFARQFLRSGYTISFRSDITVMHFLSEMAMLSSKGRTHSHGTPTASSILACTTASLE